MKIKKSIVRFSGLLMVLGLLFTLAVPVFAQDVVGTTISTTMIGSGNWKQTFSWDIKKSVSPASWDLFKGDEGTSTFTVGVVKSLLRESAFINGSVCVQNTGSVATDSLAISVDLFEGANLVANLNLDVSNNPVLDPGERGCFSYRFNFTSGAAQAGKSFSVVANATILNEVSNPGVPTGSSANTSVVFPATSVSEGGSITVNDTNGMSWSFSDSGSVSYTKTFRCDADKGKYNNTATIVENGKSSSASVTVNCYDLEVSKTAETDFKRKFNWTIDKVGDQSSLLLSAGQSFLVNYQVTVNATSVDSDFMVSGSIVVHNPAPMAATILQVGDLISPDIAVAVDCGVSFPATIPAGGTLTCSYSSSLPDKMERLNRAKAALQNKAFDKNGFVANIGQTSFSATAPVVFGNPSVVVDECIEVTDSYMGVLGTVCATDALPKTFSYSMMVGPYNTCGLYEVNNIAAFVTNDMGATGSDNWLVVVDVPCQKGCTLTPGYWKTHSSSGPAPYDNTWALIGENTAFFSSGYTWYSMLWANSSGGNAYIILARSFIAASLNVLNGADSAAVTTEMNQAAALLASYTPSSSLSRSVRANFISLAGVLDNYNNGLVGPGHCSE